MAAYLYILRCNDDSYYIGTTRGSLEVRVAEHNSGHFSGYTSRRRPVTLVYHQEFDRIEDAIAAERQVKGWRRKKAARRRKRSFGETSQPYGSLPAVVAIGSPRERSRHRLCNLILRDATLRVAPQDEAA